MPAAAALALKNGARRCTHDRLVAAVARFGSRTALVEAMEAGWWYSCRLGPRERVVILFTDGDLLPRARADRVAFVDQQLGGTMHMRDLLAAHRYARQASPVVVLANSAQLDRPVGPRWLAAGDAAASYDPLCGHGLIASMDSGRYAAAALVASARGERGAMDTYCDLAGQRYRQYPRRAMPPSRAGLKARSGPGACAARTRNRLAQARVHGEARLLGDHPTVVGRGVARVPKERSFRYVLDSSSSLEVRS